MKNPTNHDLHIMLTRIEERQINVVEKLDNISRRQKEHEENDEERFTNLNRYAASIAMIASVIGGGVMWTYQKLAGKI